MEKEEEPTSKVDSILSPFGTIIKEIPGTYERRQGMFVLHKVVWIALYFISDGQQRRLSNHYDEEAALKQIEKLNEVQVQNPKLYDSRRYSFSIPFFYSIVIIRSHFEEKRTCGFYQ
jgi:hypothetical protein